MTNSIKEMNIRTPLMIISLIISGICFLWIQYFFPYDSNGRGFHSLLDWFHLSEEEFDRRIRDEDDDVMFKRFEPDKLPNGYSCAPFVWNYFGTLTHMKACAGFLSNEVTDEGNLVPSLGWVVYHDQDEKEQDYEDL